MMSRYALDSRFRGNDTLFKYVAYDAFRAIIYVLHCFMKKSKTGIAMTQQEKDLVAARFKEAERLYKER